MTKPTLFQRIAELLRPRKPRTPATGLGHPSAVAQTLSVDRLKAILRAAEGGDTQDLFSLYRDILLGHAHTQAEYSKRKLAALTKSLTFVPFDEENPADVKLAALADRYLGKAPGWLNPGLNHLLSGHLYPVAVLERTWKEAPPNPHGIRWVPDRFVPVPWYLLDWTGSGRLHIHDADPKLGTRLATMAEPDPSRYVVHRGHLLQDIPDHWGGPMRAVLFWWLFATMDRDWWVSFLDRFGAPFLVGKYDQGDDQSRRTLASSFSAAKKLFGLVVSRNTEVEVEQIETRSSGDAFERMHNVANAEISKLILGQTMTTTAQAGGLGGAQAEVQERVRSDIEAWDITALSQTVRDQLVAEFARLNGLPGSAELSVATVSTPELGEKAQFLSGLSQAGLEPTDEGLDVLAQESGIPLQRAPKPDGRGGFIPAERAPLDQAPPDALTAAPPEPQTAPPAEVLDQVAASAAPGLALAFRGSLAPVRVAVLQSTSPQDLEDRLATLYQGWSPGRLAALTQDALAAYAANGAATARRP